VQTDPYSRLAEGYDFVMAHVDYAAWADYVQELLDRHADDRGLETLLELGCGTGELARALQPLGPYRYTGTDASAAMIAQAQQKAASGQVKARFAVADFAEAPGGAPFDAVVLLYDGLNYVLDPEGLARVFAAVHGALRPGGLFVFDQSTPANSVNNAAYFEDEGEEDGFRYVRRSHYDPATHLHTTAFELKTPEGMFEERHVERAYEIGEIRPLVAAHFDVLACYDGFSLDPAHAGTERVHWVVRRSEAGDPRSETQG
jgi:SAM-dependent methyltransferase